MIQPKNIVPVLFSLALYFSGVLVFFTPIPLVFLLLKNQKKIFWVSQGLILLGLMILYFFGVPWLQTIYAANPWMGWLVIVPGIELSGFVSQNSIAVYGLFYYLFWVACAVVLSRAYLLKDGWFRIFYKGILGSALAAILIFCALGYVNKVDPIHFLQSFFQTVIRDFVATQEAGPLSLEQKTWLKQYEGDLINLFVLLTPSFLFSSILFLYILNFTFAKRFLFSIKPEVLLARGNTWQAPFLWVWGVIFFLALFLIHIFYLSNPILKAISLNGLLITAVVYFWQGIAIVSYFFQTKALGSFMRLMGYVLFFIFFEVLGPGLILFGFADAWLNIRKRIVPFSPKS